MLARSPRVTLYTGGSDGFVASTAAPIATEWNEPVLGRDFHPQWTSAFHGARRSSVRFRAATGSSDFEILTAKLFAARTHKVRLAIIRNHVGVLVCFLEVHAARVLSRACRALAYGPAARQKDRHGFGFRSARNKLQYGGRLPLAGFCEGQRNENEEESRAHQSRFIGFSRLTAIADLSVRTTCRVRSTVTRRPWWFA